MFCPGTVWQNGVELAEDTLHTPAYAALYKMRKEKIESVFADAKEKYGMRGMQYRDLTQVTNWAKLKFAAMNLKSLSVVSYCVLNLPETVV